MAFKNYYKPTPKKWRKLGDAIMGITEVAKLGLMPIPMDEGTKVLVIYFLGLAGSVGKMMTNFFADDSSDIDLITGKEGVEPGKP